MSKQTSLAAQIARVAGEDAAAQLKEDIDTAFKTPPPGKVWVRLLRMHYDRFGVMHMPGIVALDEGFIPDSAKRLAAVPTTVAED